MSGYLDDLDRKRHHRQPRPASHWAPGDTAVLHLGPVDGCPDCFDMRAPGEAFCAACPDHEACMQAYPCGLVRSVNQEARDATE